MTNHVWGAQSKVLGWVGIDLGYAGCQAWPEQMDLAAPFTQNQYPAGSLPTAFKSQASGAALQPPVNSSAWQLLVDVENFEPKYPTSNCGSCGGSCLQGVLLLTVPILPMGAAAATPAQSPLPTLHDEMLNSSLSISLADGLGTVYPLDAQDMFQPQSRTYPPIITAGLANGTGPPGALPPWLAFSWNITLADMELESNGYEYQQLYRAVHAFSLTRYPAVAAISEDTIVLTATDQSSAQLPPVLTDLMLSVVGAGPTVNNSIPVVEVEDGQPLAFVIPNNTFQLNIPTGRLSYQAHLENPADNSSESSGAPLPSWLSFNASGCLVGIPQLGQDAFYNLTITATDAYGASNLTTLELYVRAPCPAGLFRHFRMRISPNNNNTYYQLAQAYSSYYNMGLPRRSTVCSLNIGNSTQPSEDGSTSFNFSGTSYAGQGQCSSDGPVVPAQAFQDLQQYGCSYYNTWKV